MLVCVCTYALNITHTVPCVYLQTHQNLLDMKTLRNGVIKSDILRDIELPKGT